MSRITVIQPGARLHYAVPEILARAGLLKRLYTDLHADHPVLRAVGRAPLGWQPKPLRRLLGRRLPPSLSPALVEDLPLRTLVEHARGEPGDGIRRLLARLEAAPLGGGDVIYTVVVNEDLETMRRLKARGARIVHECMIGPDVGLWLQDERRRHPGIEPDEDPATVASGRARDREKYGLADLVLVPSDFARRAVLALDCPPEKVHVVPYGLEPVLRAAAAPRARQALFVGSVGLRKGSHHLAAAARKLARPRPDISFRVVGPISARLRQHPELRGPTYVGQVPRAAIGAEYAAADVFVLPTLCDSFALVHLEAMAAGVPVITTPNCGSVVRDGVDGFIVPVRDPDAIAARVEQVVSDRALRAEMSASAQARAAEFSLEHYGPRLLAALAPVLAP